MNSRRIALVDDKQTVRDSFAECLIKAGFSVICYSTKEEALRGLSSSLPDMLLLGTELNGECEAGLAILQQVRARSASISIILITEKRNEYAWYCAMRLDADDYIPKDWLSPDFLRARVENEFRRNETLSGISPPAHDTHCIGGDIQLTFDPSLIEFTWRGSRLELSHIKAWILYELCSKPGDVLSNDQLMKAAKTHVNANTVAKHISHIRAAFSNVSGGAFERIQTVHGRGYRWIPPRV